MARGFVVAAPHSGSGKTLLTLGLLRAFRNRGLRVASAKAGPDYIDPGFHAAATGRPCINLDLWAMGEAMVRTLASRQAQDADLLVVEGVMGLFDGPDGAKRIDRRPGRRTWPSGGLGRRRVPAGPVDRSPCPRLPVIAHGCEYHRRYLEPHSVR